MVSRKVDSVKKFFPRFFLISLSVILYSCGGGGGGGTSNSGGSPTTYSYKTMNTTYSDIVSALGSSSLSSNNLSHLDYLTTGYHGRYSSANDTYCWYPSTSAEYKETVLNSTSFKLSLSYGAQSGDTATGESSCSGANVSGTTLNINSANITTSSDINFSGVLSGQIYYDHDLIGVVDSSLNETVIESTNVYGSPSSSDFTMWSGASYVDMVIVNFDYADTCIYSSGACSQVSADNTYDLDFMALLVGDQTASGDMPTSGSKSYRTKTFGFGVYGISSFLNGSKGAYSSLIAGCGTNPSFGDCSVQSIFSASAESILAFNFSESSISGSVSFSKHYSLGYSSQTDLSSETILNSSLSNLTISSVTRTGSSFSGNVSNSHFTGTINGVFYGPQASDIGAVIRIEETSSGGNFSSTGSWATFVLTGGQ